MKSYTIFIDPNTLKSCNHTNNLIEFCASICNKITFEIHISYYDLSKSECSHACNDFYNYYMGVNEKRRSEFENNIEFKMNLLEKYHTINEVSEYFDRLHQYDLVEFEEVKKILEQYVINSRKTKNVAISRQDNIILKKVFLPKEAFIGARFTLSHCTIGGLYKVYYFNIHSSLIGYLLNDNELFKFYSFEDIELENPAFYFDETCVLSVCTHERTISLHLSKEQYDIFKSLEIPFIK